MKRVMVYLTPELDGTLRALSEASRVPMAVILRDALAGGLAVWASARGLKVEPKPAPEPPRSTRWLSEREDVDDELGDE